MAVDDQGYAVKWTGSWAKPVQIVSLLTYYAFTGVSCTAPSFCILISGAGNAWTYNGTSFVKNAMDGVSVATNAIDCLSTTNCVAVDAAGNVINFTGSHTSPWSAPMSIDNNSLQSISCINSTFCIAVDSAGAYLTMHNGAWSAPSYAIPLDAMAGVACSTKPQCIAVDGNNKTASVSY